MMRQSPSQAQGFFSRGSRLVASEHRPPSQPRTSLCPGDLRQLWHKPHHQPRSSPQQDPLQGQATVISATIATEAPDTDQEEVREPEGQEDPILPLASSSSSPDEVVAGASTSGPPQIDHRAYQDLLWRIAYNMGLLAEEVVEPEDPMVDILTPEGPSQSSRQGPISSSMKAPLQGAPRLIQRELVRKNFPMTVHGVLTQPFGMDVNSTSRRTTVMRRGRDPSKLRNFSYVLRSAYRGVFTAVSRLLPLPHRLRLRLSRSWSTGVDGRALRGQFIPSRLDSINRSPLDRSLPADPAAFLKDQASQVYRVLPWISSCLTLNTLYGREQNVEPV
ncbi:hypothetical protein UY3_09900 [Chelonia mydas]|uniref:Uncharacterized protein n=1 Tax=Chelonia mydas TaxID=8469 RepID=M7BXX4_CHEMY|nr:hypothetical protein UY3_09900 [Chelonia mydas]